MSSISLDSDRFPAEVDPEQFARAIRGQGPPAVQHSPVVDDQALARPEPHRPDGATCHVLLERPQHPSECRVGGGTTPQGR